MRFSCLLFALLTSRACADINDATLAQLRLPASLDVKLKRLFPLIEQCNFARTQNNNTWLKISYDDLLRNFFLIAADIERNLQKNLNASFMSVLSQLALFICFYENVLHKKTSTLSLCGKLSSVAPTLGDIFKIFVEEFQRRTASVNSTGCNWHYDEVAAKILKMSSFDRNFVEIARSMQYASKSRYLNTIAENGSSTAAEKGVYAVVEKDTPVIANKNTPVKVLKTGIKKVRSDEGTEDDDTFGKVFAIKQPSERLAGLTLPSPQKTATRIPRERTSSVLKNLDLPYDENTSISPEDVLLALCWLSVVCRDEKTQHQVERIRTQIGHQLMRQTIIK